MLRGIDISSHQKDIDLSKLNLDFVIIKATQGVSYTNPYCDRKVQQTKQLGKLFGFYHYAADNEPEKEAQFFIDQTRGYQGQGIPVLDWEGLQRSDGSWYQQSVDWVNRFVRYYHEKTGVWPWIYANPWRFNQGGVEANCARWVAQYPNVLNPNLDYDTSNPPKTDGLVACWQYASDGRISGYGCDLDLDHFFGDTYAWKRYANPNTVSEPVPPVTEEPAKPDVSVLENENYKVTVERK